MNELNNLIDHLHFHVDDCVSQLESVGTQTITYLHSPDLSKAQKIRYARLLGNLQYKMLLDSFLLSKVVINQLDDQIVGKINCILRVRVKTQIFVIIISINSIIFRCDGGINTFKILFRV